MAEEVDTGYFQGSWAIILLDHRVIQPRGHCFYLFGLWSIQKALTDLPLSLILQMGLKQVRKGLWTVLTQKSSEHSWIPTSKACTQGLS